MPVSPEKRADDRKRRPELIGCGKKPKFSFRLLTFHEKLFILISELVFYLYCFEKESRWVLFRNMKSWRDGLPEIFRTAFILDGTPLPSEAELAAQAGVSRVTVRQALVQLSRLGIIVKRREAQCCKCRRRSGAYTHTPVRLDQPGSFRRGHSRLSGNFQYSATYDDENQRQSGFHADD